MSADHVAGGNRGADDDPSTMGPACDAARAGELDRAFELAEQALVRTRRADPPATDLTREDATALSSADEERARKVVEDYSTFALVVFSCGDADGSLRAARRLRELQEQVLGRDHPDVFATRSVIVTLTAQKGAFDEALGLGARLLTDQQRLLGADHPDTLRTRSTLAFLNAQRGDLDLAIELFRQLLADQRRVLGDDDGAVRTTHHELAFARVQRSLLEATTGSTTSPVQAQDGPGPDHGFEPELDADPEVALDQLVDELSSQAMLHGVRHPRVLMLRSLVSQCFEAVGDHLHAYVLAVGLLDDQREIQGADHPDLYQLRFAVADLMSRVGDVDGALDRLRALFEDQTNALGRDHPATVTTHHRIVVLAGLDRLLPSDMAPLRSMGPETFDGRLEAADALASEGRTVEAVARALTLLDSQLGLLGADHPQTKATSAALSTWIGEIGGFDRLPVVLTDLLTQSAVRGEEPTSIDVTSIDVTSIDATVPEATVIDVRRARGVVAAMGITGVEDASGPEFLADLLADMIDVLGPGHPDTLVVRDQLVAHAGWTQTGSTQTDVRIASAIEALVDAQTVTSGATDSETLRTRNLAADLTARGGDIEGALDRFTEILVDQRQALGSEHPDTLVTRWNIASWMGETGDLAQAIPLMVALVDDQTRIIGPNDPASLETRYTVAIWLARAGQTVAAVERLEELLAAQREVLGDDHPDVGRTRAVLSDLVREAD